MQRLALAGALDMFAGATMQASAVRRKVAGAVCRWGKASMQVGFEGWLEYMDARRVEADMACKDELSAQLHLVERRLADEAEVSLSLHALGGACVSQSRDAL